MGPHFNVVILPVSAGIYLKSHGTVHDIGSTNLSCQYCYAKGKCLADIYVVRLTVVILHAQTDL